MIDLKAVNTMTLEDASKAYLKEGWSLIPLASCSKSASVSPGWNSEKFQLCGGQEHWGIYPNDNIGCNLGKTGIVTLDIDNKDAFVICMETIREQLQNDTKIHKPFWGLSTAGIASGRKGSGKLVFSVPSGITLEPRKLRWISNGRSECVFELRTRGQQDVLPPSIHPVSLKPYQWVGADPLTILPMPEDMLYLWQNWDAYKPVMEKANPSYSPPAFTEKMRKSGIRYTGTNYIEMWKNQQNLESMLLSNGYQKKGENRLLSPDSHSGNAGIVLYDSGTSFFSFGESDKFADGHSHDAYDVLVECECHGDRKAAWEYVLDCLGVDKKAEMAKYARTMYNAGLRRKLASLPKNPLENNDERHN